MPKKAVLNPDDILTIPYTDGKSVYARVLAVDGPKVPKNRARGLYVQPLDLDVGKKFDSAAILAAKPLTTPVFTIYDALTDKTAGWTHAGHVDFPNPPVLPYFPARDGLADYLHNPVPDTPANRKRLCEYEVFQPEIVSELVGARRGLTPWVPELDKYLPTKAKA